MLKQLNYTKVEDLEGDYVQPSRGHSEDAGIDLPYNPIDGSWVSILPGETELLGTGLVFEIPPGYVGMVCPRSGMAAKRGLTVLNAPGIIDSGFTGELQVILHNTSRRNRVINPGDRIAQLVLVPIETPTLNRTEFIGDPETARGSGGFGSTGK